jgi:hypothetical protein
MVCERGRASAPRIGLREFYTMRAEKGFTWIEWFAFRGHGDMIVERRKFDVREI